MGVAALYKAGKLALIALAVAGMASVPEALRASPPIKMLPDQLCGPSVPGVITVCGSRLKREDVIRLHNLASCLASQHEKSSREALSAYNNLGVILPMLGKTSKFTTAGIRISDASFAARTAKSVRRDASSILSSRPGMSLRLRPG